MGAWLTLFLPSLSMSVRFGIRAGLLRAVPSMHGVQIKINSAIQDKNPTQITIEKCCLRHWDSSLSGRGR